MLNRLYNKLIPLGMMIVCSFLIFFIVSFIAKEDFNSAGNITETPTTTAIIEVKELKSGDEICGRMKGYMDDYIVIEDENGIKYYFAVYESTALFSCAVYNNQNGRREYTASDDWNILCKDAVVEVTVGEKLEGNNCFEAMKFVVLMNW